MKGIIKWVELNLYCGKRDSGRTKKWQKFYSQSVCMCLYIYTHTHIYSSKTNKIDRELKEKWQNTWIANF